MIELRVRANTIRLAAYLNNHTSGFSFNKNGRELITDATIHGNAKKYSNIIVLWLGSKFTLRSFLAGKQNTKYKMG